MAGSLRSLLIAPIYAASILSGGGQRTFHLYRALALLGPVDILLVSEPAFADLEAQIESLREPFAGSASVRVHRSTSRFYRAPAPGAGLAGRARYALQRVYGALRPRAALYRPDEEASKALMGLIEAENYAVVVGRYLQSTALSGALHQARVPVVVDLDDLDELVLQTRMGAPTTGWMRRLVLRRQARQLEQVTHRLRRACRHLFTAGAADRRRIDHPSVSVLPNIPFAERDKAPAAGTADPSGDPVLLFVGSHGHRVNREGVMHFVAACWPRIVARVPAARLRVVGSGGWEAERDQLEQTAGVSVIGTVEDLADEYRGAALCVVPLFEGSGTKIKVLEALMHGRVVVAARHSARGYEELVDHGVVAASNDAELADACTALLLDPARRQAMALAGQRLVRQNYGFEALFDRFSGGLIAAGVLHPDGLPAGTPEDWTPHPARAL